MLPRKLIGSILGGVIIVSFHTSNALSATTKDLITESMEKTEIQLDPDEKQLLLESIAVLKERYITVISPKKIIENVFQALKKRAERILSETTEEKIGFTRLSRLDEALNLALRGLDAHTAYLSPNAFKEMRVRTKGEFGGLGLEVTMEDGLVKVVAPIDETPAARAGMEAGDLISHVDDVPVKGMTLRQAVKLMRGPVGTRIELTVLRNPLKSSMKITIIRDVIRIRTVRSRHAHGFGYIRLTTFNQKAEKEMLKAIGKLREDNQQSPPGYVLDLRNNPGGLLNQAIKVADAFLDKGHIVSVKGRISSENAIYEAKAGDAIRGKKIVVLVNSGSASASEIVASALQDNDRAIVVGHRSFGKGSVQTVMPMGRFGALRLTTALYYTPEGAAIQARGVQPDLQIKINKESSDNKIRREENLDHALENPDNQNAEKKVLVVDPNHCKNLLKEKIDDGGLACAIAVLRADTISSIVPRRRNK